MFCITHDRLTPSNQKGLFMRTCKTIIPGLLGVFVLSLLLVNTGCGFISDKDLIKIAKIDGRYITRGELSKYLRELSDEERPYVRNKGDLIKVLNDYVDKQIKIPLGKEVNALFVSQNKTLVPREQALARYFQENKDNDFAKMYFAKDAKEFGMTDEDLQHVRAMIDTRVDLVLEKMNGDAAVLYKGIEAYKNKEMAITDEEFQQEYTLQKDVLKKFERIAFRAIRFPADTPNSSPEADSAAVRKRIDSGEDFDKVFTEYANRNALYVVESTIDNNPTLEKFRGFWLTVSGAEPGAILGPIYLPEYQLTTQNVQGQTVGETMPAAYLILKVITHTPEAPMPIEDAKTQLAPSIIVTKEMKKLREDHGVEIYEAKLPDPSLFSDQYRRSFADTPKN